MKDVYRQYNPTVSTECHTPSSTYNASRLLRSHSNFSLQALGKKNDCFCLGPGGAVAVVRTPTPTGFEKAALSRIIGLWATLPLFGRIAAAL